MTRLSLSVLPLAGISKASIVKTKSLFLVTLVSLLCCSVQAQWLLLDDFESSIVGTAVSGTTSATVSWNGDAVHQSVVDSGNVGNQVLQILGENIAQRLRANFTDPANNIAAGDVGTVFLRFRTADVTQGGASGSVVGLTPSATESECNFKCGFRLVSTPVSNHLDVRNGGEHEEIGGLLSNTWYSLWIVADNNSTNAGTFKFYLQSDADVNYVTQTQIETDDSAADDVFGESDELAFFVPRGTGGDPNGGESGGGDLGGDTGSTGEGNTGSVEVTGETYTATPDSLEDVLRSVVGGDEIIVTGSGEISIKNYNFDSPVLIRAATIGGTTLGNATVSGSNNVALQGFIFGPNDESTLLKIENSTNIKILRNLFDHKDVVENQSSIVLTQASRNVEIAYNTFKDKNLSVDGGSKITGSFIKTQFDGGQLIVKNLHVHHNHFDNIAPFLVGGVPAGDSDREAIAMGIADSQDVVTDNLVEYNLFENCDGENEIITVKTTNNIFRYNTFKNSMGSLSFRSGSNNQAYGNYFYGTGPHDSVNDENFQTGGVRIYGSGHQVHDNYMEDLTGVSWRRPVLVDSGDTSDSTGNNNHETSTNVSVSNNVIVNCVGGGIHVGSDNYSNMPTNITTTNNTVVSNMGILFNNAANRSSNAWSSNKAYAIGSANAAGGASLSSAEVEVLSSSPGISKPTPLTSSDVGRTAP